MSSLKRAGMAVVAFGLASGVGSSLAAQIPGMPLFTNPRYGTGIRVHADVGQAQDDPADARVGQAGISLAIGPVGIGANVGAKKDDLEAAANNCGGCGTETSVTASGLAQIRVAGGGRSNLSLSIFGGASVPVQAIEFAANLTQAQRDTLRAYGILDSTRVITIPVGVAVGLRIPLGLASLNLWGAPRYNLTRYSGCGNTCPDGTASFRWAAGADFPIFRIFSVRAAYDSGKIELPSGQKVTVNYLGVGVSIGIGGMR